MIDFNRPPVLGTETEFFEKALANGKLCGDGPFTKYASEWFRKKFSSHHLKPLQVPDNNSDRENEI